MQTWIPYAWRSPEAPQLSDLRALRSHIESYLADVKREQATVPPEESDFVFGDASVLVAVTGDRGSGKSSLLSLLSGSVRQRQVDVVIPTLRPEFFSSADTLVSALMSSLWQMLVDPESGPEWMRALDPEARASVSRECLSASRSYAVSQMPRSALVDSGGVAADYAEEALFVSRSTARSHKELATFFGSLLAMASSSPRPLVLVPVDDADLAPAQIGRILHDLRFIASIPGVVPIACFDFADLRSEWLSARGVNGDPKRDVAVAARLERELEKLFPQRARFSVPPLSAPARRTFTPIGRDETLTERWHRFVSVFEAAVGRGTSLNAAIATDPFPHGIASPLPSSPRSLIQLWESLSFNTALEGAPGTTDDTLLAMNRTIEIIGAPLRHWCADNGIPEPFVRLEHGPRGDRQSVTAQVALPRLGTGIAADRTFPEDQNAAQSRTVTHLRSITSTYFDAFNDDFGLVEDRVATRMRMTTEAAGALLVLQEFVLAIDSAPSRDRVAYIGVDEWRFLQRSYAASEPGSNEILAMLPCASTLGDTVALIETWNELARFFETESATVAVLTALTNSTVSYGRHMPAPVDAFDSEPDLDAYKAALTEAANLYADLASDPSTRASFVRSWYEELLPLQWHSDAFNDEAIDFFLDQHTAATRESVSDVLASHESKVFRRDDFDRVIRIQISARNAPSWLAGYEKVATRMGSKMLASIQKLQTASDGGVSEKPETAPNEIQRVIEAESGENAVLLEKALDALKEHKERLRK